VIRRLLYVFPTLFLIELVLGGPGTWLTFGGLSLRKLFFAGTLGSLWLLAPLTGRWRLRAGEVAGLLLLLATLLLWIGLVPVLRNTNLAWAVGDADALLMLFMYFPLAHLVRSGDLDWVRVSRMLMVLTGIVAVGQLAIWLFVQWKPELAGIVSFGVGTALGGTGIYVGGMPDGFFRVMWISSLFGVFAFFLSLRPEFASRWRPLVIALFATMLFVSYTRAFWLGVVLGLGLVAVQRVPGLLSRASVRTTRRGAVAAVAGTALLLAAAAFKGEAIGESLVRRFASTFDLTEDVSNAIRVDQFAALVDVWEEQPLLGTGFGGYAPQYLRSTEDPYSYELVSVALLMKTGVAGVLLVLSALAALVARAWLAARRADQEGWLANWLGMVVAFLLAIQTNPFLFNFVGIALVLFLLLDIVRIERAATPAQPSAAAG